MRLPFLYSINEWVHRAHDFFCLDYFTPCTPESTMLSQMTEFLSFHGQMLHCLHLSGGRSPKLTPCLRRLSAYTTYMFEMFNTGRVILHWQIPHRPVPCSAGTTVSVGSHKGPLYLEMDICLISVSYWLQTWTLIVSTIFLGNQRHQRSLPKA